MSARLLTIAGALVLSAACATTGASPRPFPTPAERLPDRRPAAGAPSPGAAAGVVGEALALRGTPYRLGGEDPAGFDCSGFVQYVLGRHGLLMPRTVEAQAREGRTVRLAEVRPGDLVFFSTVAPGPSHVGIAVGGGEFVHAPSSLGVVRVERLGSSYWAPRVVAVRRVLR
jgi:cell wall-associated NlpC family hydrolase